MKDPKWLEDARKNGLTIREGGVNAAALLAGSQPLGTPAASKLTEGQFTKLLIRLAQDRGWRVLHVRKSLRRAKDKKTGKEKFVTAVAGDGVGFPDLEMVRGRRHVYAELKVGRRKPTRAQLVWLKDLSGVPGVETYVWRPEMLQEILGVLE